MTTLEGDHSGDGETDVVPVRVVPVTRRKTLETRAENIAVDVNLELLESGKHSDFEIKVQDHVFKVHRILIGGKSDVIDKVIDGGFKETIEQHFELHSSKEAVAVLLWFMYTKQIDTLLEARERLLNEPYNDDRLDRIMVATDLFYLADYLLMPDLSAKAFNIIGQLWVRVITASRCSKKKLTEETILKVNKLVAYIFCDDRPFEKIREQACWALAALNNIKCDEGRVLGDDVLEYSIDLYSGFGWKLLMEQRTTREQDDQQHVIDKSYVHRRNLQWLHVWSAQDEDYVWTGCVCGFRGLCSSDCLADNRSECQRSSYCNGCRTNVAKDEIFDWGDGYFSRDKDGRIKYVLDDASGEEYVPSESDSDEDYEPSDSASDEEDGSSDEAEE